METPISHSNPNSGSAVTSPSKYENDTASPFTDRRSSKHRHRDGHHHHHHQHHHQKKRHHRTVDIDNYFFQTQTDNKTSNGLNTDLHMRNGDKHENGNMTPPSIKITMETSDSPPNNNKSATMDGYSVSDLFTSDDAAPTVAKPRRKLSDTRKPTVNGTKNGYHDSSAPPPKSPKVRERRAKGGQMAKDSKDDVVSAIEKHLKICQLNYEQVESQINSTFSTLSNSINFRRKALIEEAKLIRDRKVNSLYDVKETFVKTQQPVPTYAGEHPKQNGGNDVGLNQSEESVSYSIHEPWGSGGVENGMSCREEKRKEQEVEVKCLYKLEEGNMTFNFNVDDGKFINAIGNIKESLSSARCSYVTGLDGKIGISGDKIHFEVHTVDVDGNVNNNMMDSLLVRVYDGNKNKVPVTEITTSASHEQFGTIARHMSDAAREEVGVYRYSFVPTRPGNHEILVKLNDMEINPTPFDVLVYVKSDLTFEDVGDRSKERHCSEPELRVSSTSSFESSSCGELTNSEAEEDEDCFSHNPEKIRERDWIVQKGGKSSLLRSLAAVPSNIYASAEVQGMCAWQLRVTSACMNIVLSVGVRTRCETSTLNEQFTCDFNLETFLQTAANLDKVNHPAQTARRKSSMFSRLSWTFTVLLNDGCVRVSCHELDEDQKVDIHLKNPFTLHPFCSMMHHHKGSVSQVCPRPQLTFL